MYVDGSLYVTSSSTSISLTNATQSYSQVTVSCAASNFLDSNQSNACTLYKYFSITMMDDDMTTVLQTQSVRYGLMPTYLPAKAGYEFQYWVDSNGNQVTAIDSEIVLYAVWVQINNFVFKNHYDQVTATNYSGTYMNNCKVSPNGKYIAFYTSSTSSTNSGSLTFVNLETETSQLINNVSGLTTSIRKLVNMIFSPDSTKLYVWYCGGNPASSSACYLVIFNTSDLTKTNYTTNYCNTPSNMINEYLIDISPDGNYVATMRSSYFYIHNLTTRTYKRYSSPWGVNSNQVGLKYDADGQHMYSWSTSIAEVFYTNEDYAYVNLGSFAPSTAFNIKDNLIRYNSSYFGRLSGKTSSSTVTKLVSELTRAQSTAFAKNAKYAVEVYNNATTPIKFFQIDGAYSQMPTPELPSEETPWTVSANVKVIMSDQGNTAVVYDTTTADAWTKIYVYTRQT